MRGATSLTLVINPGHTQHDVVLWQFHLNWKAPPKL